jgi:hypothetical protein
VLLRVCGRDSAPSAPYGCRNLPPIDINAEALRGMSKKGPARRGGPKGVGVAAIALPECGVSGWLSPEDHDGPYNTMRKLMTIFLNRS